MSKKQSAEENPIKVAPDLGDVPLSDYVTGPVIHASVPEGAPEIDKSDDPKPPVPGDPDYDWSQHYPDGTELFTYTFPGGKTVALKAFSAIYSKTWLYKISELQSDIDIEFAALKRGGCPQVHAVLIQLDDTVGDPIADLYRAWIGAEGLDSGE
ncbi:hypothetical protein [Mycobacterium sp. HM-7]